MNYKFPEFLKISNVLVIWAILVSNMGHIGSPPQSPQRGEEACWGFIIGPIRLMRLIGLISLITTY